MTITSRTLCPSRVLVDLQGGARCQNLGHLKIFFFFSFIESFDLGQQVLIRTGYLCVTSHFRVHDPEWGSQGGGIL